MNEKENEKVTRRKFLEDSSRKALAGSAAAFLGLGMIRPKYMYAATTCSGACTGDCIFTCRIDCTLTCKVDCYGICKDDCQTNCSGDCSGSCSGTCWAMCSGKSSPSGASPQAQHGTPVSEREISTRHVTV